MKIKAIPIKSETLCEKCFYDVYCDTHNCGSECPMYNKRKKGDETWHCKCLNLADGEPCRHFKRKQPGLELTNDAIRFLDKNGHVIAEVKALKNGNIRISHCESGVDNGK